VVDSLLDRRAADACHPPPIDWQIDGDRHRFAFQRPGAVLIRGVPRRILPALEHRLQRLTGMSTTSGAARSTQQDQIPDAVEPERHHGATAELGSEGGSYGDLTQSVRTREESGGVAAERHGTWRLVPLVLLVLLVLITLGLVLVTVTVWAG
jgi:hypothetical protein